LRAAAVGTDVSDLKQVTFHCQYN